MSSQGNISYISDLLFGEHFPTHKKGSQQKNPVTISFEIILDVRLNKP